MKITSWFAAVTVAWFALPAMMEAQEAPLRLTLEDVLAKAQQNSLRVAELQARADAAAAIEAGRHAADMPLVSAQGGYTRTNHVERFALAFPNQPLRVLYPDAPSNYRTRLDLQWPIYTGGGTDALERAASAEGQAAAFDVAAARADLKLEATRAFWALVTADQTEDVAAHALASTDAHVRDLRSRLAQGLIPPNEVLSAEAQRSRQQLLSIEARNRRGVAEADLRRIIGEDARVGIEPVVRLEPSPVALLDTHPSEANKLLDSARAQRPERKAFDSRVAAGRDREAATAASRRPLIALGAGYDYARPNPHIFPRLDEWRESWDASVNVSWTLWDGGRRRAEEAEAAAGTRVLVARASDFDRQLAFEVEQRRLEMDSTQAAITAAEDGVRAAAEARRVIGERYAAGVATNTEVLDADTALLQSQLDRTRAIADARLAAARLDRAIGR